MFEGSRREHTRREPLFGWITLLVGSAAGGTTGAGLPVRLIGSATGGGSFSGLVASAAGGTASGRLLFRLAGSAVGRTASGSRRGVCR